MPHSDDIEETIDGQTSIDDISGLRDRTIRTKAELNRREAINIAKATLKYLARRPTAREAPFDYDWLLQLHREMLGEIWEWAGTLRTGEVSVGVLPHQIATQLHELLLDLKEWSVGTMSLAEQATRLHHRAVQIHPFPNGNGRWSRLLANTWLRRHGEPIIEWPEELMGTSSVIRARYLDAIRAADRGEYEGLLALHREHARR
jgi:Fic-DOC domain mobile mystery protein B